MINQTPKVSIILPTYNRAYIVERAIRSILDQTYNDFELIIVDDGSTDNTEEIIKELQQKDKRIQYIKLDTNKGAAAARNVGIRSAKGQYIAFQDSDDEWLPEKLEKQMKIIETVTEEVGVVYTDMLLINKDNQITYWNSPSIKYGDIINSKTHDYQVLGLGIVSTLIKNKSIDYFDETFYRFIDLEYFIRLSKKVIFIHINEPLVKYHITDGISCDFHSLFIARKKLFKKYYNELRKDKKFIANQYFEMGYALFVCKHFKYANKFFLKAINTSPINIKFWLIFLSTIFKINYYKTIRIYGEIQFIKRNETSKCKLKLWGGAFFLLLRGQSINKFLDIE